MRCSSVLNDTKCSFPLEARSEGWCQFMFTQAKNMYKYISFFLFRKELTGQKWLEPSGDIPLHPSTREESPWQRRDSGAQDFSPGERQGNNTGRGAELFLTDSVKRDGAARDNTGFRRRGNITGRTQAASQGAGQMGLQSAPTVTSPEVIYSSRRTCLQILTVQGASRRSQVACTCRFRTQNCAILFIIARQREALRTCSTGGKQIIGLARDDAFLPQLYGVWKPKRWRNFFSAAVTRQHKWVARHMYDMYVLLCCRFLRSVMIQKSKSRIAAHAFTILCRHTRRGNRNSWLCECSLSSHCCKTWFDFSINIINHAKYCSILFANNG